MPVIIEAFGMSLAGFLAGLFLAYLLSLHRRANADWRW